MTLGIEQRKDRHGRPVTSFNFECHTCERYVRPNKKGCMGFCPMENKKVAKSHSCRRHSNHIRFWFLIKGVTMEQVQAVELSELERIRDEAIGGKEE